MSLILNSTILFLVGLLVFILPIGHTIAIRNIAIFLLLLVSFYLFKKYKIKDSQILRSTELYNISKIILLISIWMLVVTFFISNETIWSLKEIKSEWIVPLVYFYTFILLSSYSLTQSDKYKKVFYLSIFLPIFVHVLYIDYFGIKYYFETNQILSRFGGLTQGPDKSNYLTNILLAFIISELIYRFRYSKKIININNFTLSLILFVTLLSSLFEGMRNGVVAIIFLGISAIFFSFYKNTKLSKKLKITSSVLLLMLLSVPAIYNIKNDKRWEILLDTIPYALDTQVNKHWLDQKKYALPKFPNGNTVEGSAYLRFAWGYEGLKLISENPFGIGYGRNAFGHAIKDKYNLKNTETNVGHSHSGIIDLTVGIGIPGLILWISFGLYLMYLSYRYFVKYQSFFALVVFFNITGFFSRFLVDSNMRDHMFQTFMLIIGFSIALMLKDKLDYEKTSSN